MLRVVYGRTKNDTPEEMEFRKEVLEIFYAKMVTLGKEDRFINYISANRRLLQDFMGAVAERGIGPRDRGLMLDIQGDMVSWTVKTSQENNSAEAKAADGDGQ